MSPITEELVGQYTILFRAFMQDYESVSEQYKPKSTTLQMTLIVETGIIVINQPPYFDTPLEDIFPV